MLLYIGFVIFLAWVMIFVLSVRQDDLRKRVSKLEKDNNEKTTCNCSNH